jgi:5'-nucleotidase
MRILLSNDDGVHAEGLKALHHELRKIADVWVVAPLEEKSTTGHSLTLHKPLRIMEIDVKQRIFGVNGSPADCIALGMKQVIGKKPDVVISGINRGANLGQDVYYSGTVSAAREACIMGIPSLAVSLAIDFKKAKPSSTFHYLSAAKIAVRVLKSLKKMNLPYHTLLNVNVPDLPLKQIKGIEIARQGFRHYTGDVLKRRDHRGKNYYWLGGHYLGFRQESGTDCAAVANKHASITPLKLDSTDASFLQSLNRAEFGDHI